MSKEITNMQIKLISLVSAGANNKKIIYKNENFNELLRVNFKKSDDEQGVVYGIVYAPDEVDTQGDFANANEIKRAAYNFMKRADLGYCVDVNHDFNIANAYICESWIVKSKDEFFSEVGAWAVGIKLEDEDLKQMVKNGAITGLSMYGSGVIKNADEGITKGGVMAALKEFFGSSENLKKQTSNNKGETMDENKVAELVKAGISASEAKLEALEKSVGELTAKLEAITSELSKSKQDETIKKQENSLSGGIL
ncbi:hypothetical protein CCAL9344_01305 [Campylobacter sp. RM9344]|uniref:Phage-like element PBSX protein XkdF domain-containing protein n=1 Tax=Campylobacter californiensis TaxID=1032243 RepID=A0AAW3ZSA4_9BACT|nr:MULTISPECIES: XkdF-like putative serine protease domain-containing protein [unclassified Campylobacter]MBE2984653.1 hypothetical protein [Campylobacter sp. RM6883]MBE2994569.1 hypothetical protein [Campylobacter sp. RM6913]MBE3028836.1 hypothetical protein [Campylobacter sp. RM9344]MBE3607194.1 hypothetical protein [Campylobacter sp. RM9337]QCD50380.1 putative protease [Campylobacter sp. RM6914]